MSYVHHVISILCHETGVDNCKGCFHFLVGHFLATLQLNMMHVYQDSVSVDWRLQEPPDPVANGVISPINGRKLNGFSWWSITLLMGVKYHPSYKWFLWPTLWILQFWIPWAQNFRTWPPSSRWSIPMHMPVRAPKTAELKDLSCSGKLGNRLGPSLKLTAKGSENGWLEDYPPGN